MTEPRIALRPDSDGVPALLDDVVVRDVDTFRAEMLSDKALWMRCYLPDTGVDQDFIDFHVGVRKGRLVFTVTEFPSGEVTYEPQEAA